MKYLFMVCAVLSVFGQGAFAQDIKYITMDTPVKWSAWAINSTIENLLGNFYYEANFSSDEVGDFYGQKLPDAFAKFINNYLAETKSGRRALSLREMVDICMDSEIHALYCERLVKGVFHKQNDVYYSLESSLSSDLDAIYETDKVYSDDGKYYAKIFVNREKASYIVYRANDNVRMCAASDVSLFCITDEDAVLYNNVENATFELYDESGFALKDDYSPNDSFGKGGPVLRYTVRK